MKSEHCPNETYFAVLAAQAGEIMRKNFCLGMERTSKDDNTPVTASDTRINQLVIDSIRRDFPHVRVIGEEGNYDVADAEYTVLCDPVDGTIPFCRGIPIATFVISVIKENWPLVAVIYDPFMSRMWSATRGQGTFLNGKPVRVSTHAELKGTNACLLFWHGSEFNLYAVCHMLMEAGVTWGNPLTVAYYGGLLASGEQDAIIFPGRKGWETAAMQLLATEAGGKATDIYGKPLQYGPNGEIKGHIISNGLIHDQLVEMTTRAAEMKGWEQVTEIIRGTLLPG